jgi:hypothetical protein
MIYSQTIAALSNHCPGQIHLLSMIPTFSRPCNIAKLLHVEASTPLCHRSHSILRDICLLFESDACLAEPGKGSTRQVNNILCQAVHHDHEDISADRGQNMPPAMELQYETPRHPDGAFPCSQLGAIDEVELPEKVAKDEASCVGVSLPLSLDV